MCIHRGLDPRRADTGANHAFAVLTHAGGGTFDGNIVLREVISTSSVDGTKVADSLPALGTT